MRALAGFRIIINCAAVSAATNFSLSFLLSQTALHFTCNSARLKVDRESNSHWQEIQSAMLRNTTAPHLNGKWCSVSVNQPIRKAFLR